MTINKNIKILVVDDYQIMRIVIQKLLNKLGFFNIELAADGSEALAIINTQIDAPFDLIISDWSMEPMSGLQLLINIRNHPDFKHIPFIMATAENKSQNFIDAQKAGVSDYLIKPFDLNGLNSKILNVLN